MCVCVCVCVCVYQALWDPWTVVFQAPLSMEFSKQEYWSGFPFLSKLEVFWFFIFNLLWSWAVYFASLILDFLAFKLCLKVDFLCVTSLTLVFSGSISSVEIHWVIGRDVLSCIAQELQGTPLSLYSV